jgi:aminopeptidase
MSFVPTAHAWKSFVGASLMLTLLASCSEPETALSEPATAAASADHATSGLPEAERDELARRLVTQSAGVREGDVVLVSGSVRDVGLLEDIAVQVRRAGAFPLVTLGSDRMTRRMFDDVDPRFDSQMSVIDLKLMEMVDVLISVEAGESEDLLAHVSPERMTARARANEPVAELFQQRAIRAVNLGNQLYPTRQRAERFGIPQEQLARMFWDGVNLDYRMLEERGRAIQGVLGAGREMHIASAAGTDLRLRVDGRPSFVNDGVISEADRARGSAGSQAWLPAGEIYLAPVPGSAEGTVVIDRHTFQGAEIRGLRLTFSNGRLIGMTAESGLEPLTAYYEAAGDGKDELSVIDFGFNPNVRIPSDSRVVSWVADGMVTIVLGGNTWAGGSNTSSFALAAHIPGSTVTVDGRTLVQNGAITP